MTGEGSSYRFIVDSMHGALARMLRIMGHDTLYVTGYDSDTRVLEKCASQNRILITGDRELHSRCTSICRSIYIPPSTPTSRAIAIIAKQTGMPLRINIRESRCPYCNTLLEPSPENLPWIKDSIYKCPSCNNYYWKGRHWRGLTQILEEAEQWLKKL